MRKGTFITALIGVLMAHAQITPTVEPVDFGRINEADGPKTVRTYVRNDGDKPVAILKVRPTCGCTAADFMKEEFAPGDSAWIELTYNPYLRPGAFEKGVKVYPTEGDMIRIPITGVVFATPESLKSSYPVQTDHLYLSEQTLMPPGHLGNDEKTFYVDLYNAGEEPVYTLLESLNEAMEAQMFPDVVQPGHKGLIGIYIKPQKETRTGGLDYTLLMRQSTTEDNLEDQQPTEIKILIER